jgi:hypothetical protein
MNAQFLAIAQDPRIIPGVHHYCDEWCTYCPVTARCLAFRCTEEFKKQHGRGDNDPTFANMDEAVAFTRELSAIEGVRTDELDALVSRPPGKSGLETSDPIASIAWEYAVRAGHLMTPVAQEIASMPREPSAGAPGAIETLLWYHLRIYMKVVRALVGLETSTEGAGSEDALGCAKLALVSIERSRTALLSFRKIGGARGKRAADPLIALLDALSAGLDERIPRARAFVRFGLDCPGGVVASARGSTIHAVAAHARQKGALAESQRGVQGVRPRSARGARRRHAEVDVRRRWPLSPRRLLRDHRARYAVSESRGCEPR